MLIHCVCQPVKIRFRGSGFKGLELAGHQFGFDANPTQLNCSTPGLAIERLKAEGPVGG